MVWTNQNLTLFHGTHSIAVESIRSDQRFRLDLVRSATDFGRGIYTTTNFDQARFWADRAALKFENRIKTKTESRVITASIDRVALSRLSILFFIRPNKDFWDLTHYCRAGNSHAVEVEWYDVVAGPLPRFPRRGIFRGGDQVSFHTKTSCELLYNSIDWNI